MDGIADYNFVERLGEGNHGTFWLAKRPARLTAVTAEFVAVKTLAQQATDQDFARMEYELRAYAAVESPHLVPIYDAGYHNGRLFYATAYFADGSLGAPARPMDRPEVVAVVADAADGAHALHEAGIAHRDIKPANVMLRRVPGIGGADSAVDTVDPVDGSDRGENGPPVRAMLGDLGLAQVINPGQTVTGIGPVGTIEYLAPEQVQGRSATRASDVWSLGVTLHRALTGRGVYNALPVDSQVDALRYIMTTRPQLDDTLDQPLRSIIERCLSQDPAARFSTAAELASELRLVGRP